MIPIETVEDYDRIIKSLAKKITSKEELQKDLIQEGYVGLLNAKRKYDKNLGVKFTTYAFPFIKGAMIDYIKEYTQYNDEHVPLYSMKDKNLVTNNNCYQNDITVDLEYLLEDSPKEVKKIIGLVLNGYTIREIAEVVGYSKSKVSYILDKERKRIYNKLLEKGDFNYGK